MQADRFHQIEEELRAHRWELNELKQKATGEPDKQLEIDPAFDAAGQPSHQKSSVASTELPDNDDDAPTMAARDRFPMDDITESTPCELHVPVANLSIAAAVGYAIPIPPKEPTYHCVPVPDGYAVVGVDEVAPSFEQCGLTRRRHKIDCFVAKEVHCASSKMEAKDYSERSSSISAASAVSTASAISAAASAISTASAISAAISAVSVASADSATAA